MYQIKFNTLTGPVTLTMTQDEVSRSVYAEAAASLAADKAAVSLTTLGIPNHGRVEIAKVQS